MHTHQTTGVNYETESSLSSRSRYDMVCFFILGTQFVFLQLFFFSMKEHLTEER